MIFDYDTTTISGAMLSLWNIWLEEKSNQLRNIKSVNVAESMYDILLLFNYNVLRDVKPGSIVVGSIVWMCLKLREMLLELVGLQAQTVAKLVFFKWFCAFKLLSMAIWQ